MPPRGRPPKNRRRPPEGVAGILRRALLRQGLTEQVTRLELMALWPEAVGQKIAARTQPHSFSRGTLVVTAATSTWQNELMFLREAIVARLNERLGRNKVRALKVISAMTEAMPRVAEPSRPAPPGVVQTTWASDCSQDIADENVRKAFASMMARGLMLE